MIITYNTETDHLDEATALIALLASLGGRLPTLQACPVMPEITVKLNVDTSKADMAIAGFVENAPPPPADVASHDTTSLDADGIPWDERIHASTKTRKGDDTWTKRRGVDEVTYGQVYAELQEQYPAGNTAGRAGAPPPPTDTESIASADGAPATSERTAPPPPADTGKAPPPPPTVGNALTAAGPADAAPVANASVVTSRFPEFPAFVQAVNAIRAGGYPYLELNTHAQALGVETFAKMKDHPTLWETFFGLAGGE